MVDEVFCDAWIHWYAFGREDGGCFLLFLFDFEKEFHEDFSEICGVYESAFE